MEKRSVERAWVLPDEPVPVRLMATIWADTGGVHDDLMAPSDVDEWLDAIGVDRHGAAATREEFLRARHLRDSTRRLAALVTRDDRAAAVSAVSDVDEAIRTVNAIASELPAPRLRLSEGSLDFAASAAASPVIAGLARVAAEAQRLLGEDGAVLRTCHAPGCVLYFTKTHPRREWCSVACGNRARAARHYQAVRSARTASSS
jgi:predicted RNA-binding Zn ribbon-like protein